MPWVMGEGKMTTEQKLESIPIGYLFDIPFSKKVPKGWQKCNGNKITNKKSPMYGQKTPDLREMKTPYPMRRNFIMKIYETRKGK